MHVGLALIGFMVFFSLAEAETDRGAFKVGHGGQHVAARPKQVHETKSVANDTLVRVSRSRSSRPPRRAPQALPAARPGAPSLPAQGHWLAFFVERQLRGQRVTRLSVDLSILVVI